MAELRGHTKRDAVIAIFLNRLLHSLLMVVSIAALVVAKHEAWHQPWPPDERRVATDHLADVVSGNEDALEAIEACGNANLSGIGFAKIHANMRVVVDEGRQLRHAVICISTGK